MNVIVIIILSLFVLLWGSGGISYLICKHFNLFSKEEKEFLGLIERPKSQRPQGSGPGLDEAAELPDWAKPKKYEGGFLWFS